MGRHDTILCVLVLALACSAHAGKIVPLSGPYLDGIQATMNQLQPMGKGIDMINKVFVTSERGILVCSSNLAGLTEARTKASGFADNNTDYMNLQILEVLMYNNAKYDTWSIVRENTLLTGALGDGTKTNNYDALVRWRVTCRVKATNKIASRLIFTKHNPWGCGNKCWEDWKISFICPSIPKLSGAFYPAGRGGNRFPLADSAGKLLLSSSPSSYALAIVRNLLTAIRNQDKALFHRQFHNETAYRATGWKVTSTGQTPTRLQTGQGNRLTNTFTELEFNYNYKSLGFSTMTMEIVDYLQLTKVRIDQYIILKQTLGYPAGDTRKAKTVWFWVKLFNDGRCGHAKKQPVGVPFAECQFQDKGPWLIVTHLNLASPVQTYG